MLLYNHRRGGKKKKGKVKKMMTKDDFNKAVAEGKMFVMKKYKYNGEWHNGKVVTAEVALKKSKVKVSYMGCDYCPYSFELVK
jgi:hypothetical protein